MGTFRQPLLCSAPPHSKMWASGVCGGALGKCAGQLQYMLGTGFKDELS